MATFAALGVLLMAPNLSTGAEECGALTGIAPPAVCSAKVVQSTLKSLPSLAPKQSSDQRATAPRAAAENAATTPPLHGADPHGEGTVAVIDTNPDPKRPFSSDPTGKTDNEDIVVGRSRGEQHPDGSYHGHITVAALFGNEIVGVDTNPGEEKHGPLDAVQTNLLNAICDGSGNQICLSLVTADSSTNAAGSTNRFSVAHAKLGGDQGLEVGAAESDGNISGDGTCQTSHGDSQAADIKGGGMAVASVGKSSTDSKACRGQAPAQTNTSSVIALGGTGVPLPAPGCDDGTPDTVTGIPTILPIVCNADDTNAGQTGDPYGVREALDVFVLATDAASLAKVTAVGSDSHAVAPAGPAETAGPQCADGVDNDGDGLVDAADPGCHSDNNPNNPASYDNTDNDETDAAKGTANEGASGGKAQCADGKDNDGDGLVDKADPGCHSDGNPNNAASYNAKDDSEAGGGNAGAAQCSDNVDNDGDGVIDENDPGCHSDGNANNAASYNPNDDSEANGVVRASSGNLPFTGTDLLLTGLIGALLLAAGLAIRTQLTRRLES